MQISFYNTRGLKLAALLKSVSSKAIVILAHGFTNNKSSNGRFDRLSESLNKIGYDTLAFDFSGCGDSDDDTITSQNQMDDLSSAIEFALLKGYEKIGLFGNSLGALACLKCYRNEIVTMVLTCPITDSMHYKWSDYFSRDQMDELERNGYFYMGSSSDSRKHKIVKQTLMDFEQVNQRDLIRNIICPVLIIHGNCEEDYEEMQLLERSRKAIELLPGNSKLEIIEGAKHGLRNEWEKVIEISCNWYIEQMR